MKNIFVLICCLVLCNCMDKATEKKAVNSVIDDTDSVSFEKDITQQKTISTDDAVKLAMKQFDAYLPTIYLKTLMLV